MILARIAKALREQSWLAVGIEFVIVVAGVVIGFQVSQWADEVDERAARQALLVRMQVESESNLRFWTEWVADFIERDRQRVVLLESLTTGTVEPGREDDVYTGLERIAFYPTPYAERVVLDEVLATGDLRRIANVEVQAAIAEYAASLGFIEGQLTQFRSSVEGVRETFDRRIVSEYDPDNPTLRRFRYDVAALAADEAFVSEMVDAARNQRVFFFFYRGVLSDALAMCRAIAAAQDVPCAPEAEAEAVLQAAREVTE